MKKIFLLVLVGITISFGLHAQKKSGYVNLDEIIQNMPDYKKADTAMGKYAKDIQAVYNSMVEDYQKQVKAYQDGEAKMSDVAKEAKQKDIQALGEKIQNYQTEQGQKVEEKRSELLKPIYEKAQAAIKTVGTEGGYDYIYNFTYLLYAKDTENLTGTVKAKLGIK